MHLHAYSVPGVRVVPPRHEREEWEPDEVLIETEPAVDWLANAMRELTGAADMDLSDEMPLWSGILGGGQSVHTGARGTTLLMETWSDCECDQDQEARVAPLRRGRRR